MKFFFLSLNLDESKKDYLKSYLNQGCRKNGKSKVAVKIFDASKALHGSTKVKLNPVSISIPY